jgi:hypothetical protein
VKIGSGILDYEEFDLAFSFAGEDRKVVEKIFRKLTDAGIRVFYDSAYQAQLVGKDLYTGLRDLYRNKGKYVVCFISEHYAKKMWTNLEFTAIKERLMITFFAGDFLIPILIGKADMIRDIPIFIGFYRHISINQTVEMIKEKIKSSIMEDNFLLNINNFISYLCNQVCIRLHQRNIQVVQENSNTLKIIGIQDFFTIQFSSDPIAQTPCILIMKECQCFSITSRKNPFPIFVLTWKKHDNLLFSIHDFDGPTNNIIKYQPFSDIVQYICLYVERCLGG